MCIKMSIGYSWVGFLAGNPVTISKLRIKVKLECLLFLASKIFLAFLALLLFLPLIRIVTYIFDVSICWENYSSSFSLHDAYSGS